MGHKHTNGVDEGRRAERARDIALFRYALVRPAIEPGLTTRQRGRLVRELADAEHSGPFGERVQVSRVTLDRWVRALRTGGFDALIPSARHAEPRTDAVVLELAAGLKREVPGRTAAQITAILAEHANTAVPSARTLQRHFARLELNTRPDGTAPKAFGRFEAAAPNDRWTGDALHGPKIGGRKTYLFAFIDDHSRALVGYRWGHSEDTVRLEAALRHGLAARGIPKIVYLDNGAAMVSKQLLRALAVLGIQLVHSRPGQPAGRGKIERFFRTVREQFLIELAVPGALDNVDGLAGLNELFTAWVETIYHHRIHTETEQTPLARFATTEALVLPSPALLAEAFLWSERRLVTKTATVSLHGNTYEVDAALVGRRVELVFDPFDLTALSVRFQDRDMGSAVPHQIGRHVHPAAKCETGPEPVPVTGIDYLGLVRDRHTATLAEHVNYAGLAAREAQPSAGAGNRIDAALEAELASFAALAQLSPTAVTTASTEDSGVAGQLDLVELLNDTHDDSHNRDNNQEQQ